MIDAKSSPPVRRGGGVGRSRVSPSRGNDVDDVVPVASVVVVVVRSAAVVVVASSAGSAASLSPEHAAAPRIKPALSAHAPSLLPDGTAGTIPTRTAT